MANPRDLLIEKARSFSVGLEAGAADRMSSYLGRMLEVNAWINLTAVRDQLQAVERHLLDSLAFGLHVRESGAPRRLVDLGSGGGFPGVPIALAWPGTEVRLVDSTRKKVMAVEQILAAVPIPNVSVLWARGGEADLPDALARSADVVTARAVGSLAEIVRQSHGLLAPHGCLVAWKSDVPPRERRDGAAAAAGLRMESLPDLEYELGRSRRLVRFRRRD